MIVNIHYLENNQKDLQIYYDYINSPFALMGTFKDILLMCVKERDITKICYLGFLGDAYKSKDEILKVAKKSFKKFNPNFIKADLAEIGKDLFLNNKPKDIILIGTLFQIDVWKALLKVKKGEVISYEELSKRVENLDNNKNYTRATSNAVANNKISFIIPCHRIINKNGLINKYLWGVEIKRKILKYESIEI